MSDDCSTNYLCKELACKEVCKSSLSFMENICLKCDNTVSDEDFNDAWQGGKCQSTILEQYYNGGGGILEAQKRTNRVLEFMMGADGSRLVANGTDESQNSVLEMCQGYYTEAKGACDNYIINRLANNGLYNYDMMSVNTGVVNWLGCFIPPPADEIVIYKGLETSVTEVCQNSLGATPCYPMCHRISTIQRYAPCYSEVCRCDPNVCVIDGVSVNGTSDSSIGNLGITQICPQCTGTTACECIISSSDLQQTIGDAGISTSFNQYCGDGVCYQIEDGILVPVKCSDYLGQPSNPANNISIPIIVFIVGGVLFLIAILAMLATRKTIKEEPKPEPKPEPKRGEISYEPLGNIKFSTDL